MRKLIFITILVMFTIGLSCIKKIEHLEFSQSVEQNINFQYSSANAAYLLALKEKFQLDTLVQHADTDLEKAQIICDWVHHLWEHDGLNTPTSDDPVTIIEEALTGKSFRCVEYSIVIQGCLTALAVPARVVVLMTKDVETVDKWGSHYVVEAYLPDVGKWCMIDGQRNALPARNGVPLNAVEFQAALANKDEGLMVLNLSDLSTPPYFRWITPSLYYFQYSIDNRVGVSDRLPEKIMLVPDGAKEPKIFQQKWKIENTEYTNSLYSIYGKPIVE